MAWEKHCNIIMYIYRPTEAYSTRCQRSLSGSIYTLIETILNSGSRKSGAIRFNLLIKLTYWKGEAIVNMVNGNMHLNGIISRSTII